jgi:hypothetical protein
MIAGSPPLAVRTREDVLAVLPVEYKERLDAPVRDALVDALLALLLAAQDAADYAAAQSDTATAEDSAEDALFEERGTPRGDGESNNDYRDRALASPQLVKFSAIRDAVNAVLAPVTDIKCALSDLTLDRLFISDGSLSWHSFIGRGPDYPERFFEGNIPNNPFNAFVEGNDPGGAIPGSGTAGRHFLLRVPDLAGLVNGKITPAEGADPAAHRTGFFVGDGSYPLAFVSGGQFDTSVYTAIVSTVNAIVGHSIRWTMFADPNLV